MIDSRNEIISDINGNEYSYDHLLRLIGYERSIDLIYSISLM
jgi:hypothetical protein